MSLDPLTPQESRKLEALRTRKVAKHAVSSSRKSNIARGRERHAVKKLTKKLPPGEKLRPMDELVDQNWFLWLWTWLKATMGTVTKVKLPRHTAAPNNAVYTMPDDIRIGVAADWGSGTIDAVRVAEGMRAQALDMTIHMGDVYFVGATEEYAEIFLGTPMGREGSWPRGLRTTTADATALPTYAMCGNHEMMSGGYGFYRETFKALGQQTSFFCVENKHWRVVALDTGYRTPRTMLSTVIFDTWLHVANTLPQENIDWLRDVVFKDPDDTRPVIFLSHHQPFSAYEAQYPLLVKQLAPWLGKAPLWYWGHEHRLALYEKVTTQECTIRGRCIGHAGMPDDMNYTPTKPEWGPAVTMTQKAGRGIPDEHGHKFSYCGWLTFEFNGPEFKARYFEEDPDQTHVPFSPPKAPVLEESWTVGADGGITGKITHFDDTAMELAGTHQLGDLVK